MKIPSLTDEGIFIRVMKTPSMADEGIFIKKRVFASFNKNPIYLVWVSLDTWASIIGYFAVSYWIVGHLSLNPFEAGFYAKSMFVLRCRSGVYNLLKL